MSSYLSRMRDALPQLLEKPELRILGIESSCDETAAAVVMNGRSLLSDVVHSQIDLHTVYGGVVPEIASRAHVEKIGPVVRHALDEAGLRMDQLDAVAVTSGPGLVGALLVGVSYAKGLALALEKPLLAVNHIEGHICANYLSHPELQPPFLCLVVSGGHSHLVEVLEDQRYRLIGCTQDDAAGEAFDKAARQLELPYPGGPRLDELADTGDPMRFKLPRAAHPAADGLQLFRLEDCLRQPLPPASAAGRSAAQGGPGCLLSPGCGGSAGGQGGEGHRADRLPALCAGWRRGRQPAAPAPDGGGLPSAGCRLLCAGVALLRRQRRDDRRCRLWVA